MRTTPTMIVTLSSFLLLISTDLRAGEIRNAAAADLFGQKIEWRSRKPLPLAVRNGSATACIGRIYFMGGYCASTEQRFETVNFEYTPETDAWRSKAPLPTGRSNFTLATVKNKIYAIGGDPFSGQNEMYDPQTDDWTERAPMPTPRQHLYGTVLNGKIYMIGGLQEKPGAASPSQWSYQNISAKNEAYNPETDTWEEKSPLPTPRHDAHAAAEDGKIYIIGGMGVEKDIWKTLSDVEMYDPETDKWETKASLPDPRDGFGLFVFEGKIYVVGGFNDDQVVKTVFVYDPPADSWSATTDFPNTKHGAAGAALLGARLFMIGGCDRNYTATDQTMVGLINSEKKVGIETSIEEFAERMGVEYKVYTIDEINEILNR